MGPDTYMCFYIINIINISILYKIGHQLIKSDGGENFFVIVFVSCFCSLGINNDLHFLPLSELPLYFLFTNTPHTLGKLLSVKISGLTLHWRRDGECGGCGQGVME